MAKARDIIWQLYEPHCQVHGLLFRYLEYMGKSEDPSAREERKFARAELKKVNNRIEYLIKTCTPESYANSILKYGSGQILELAG